MLDGYVIFISSISLSTVEWQGEQVVQDTHQKMRYPNVTDERTDGQRDFPDSE